MKELLSKYWLYVIAAVVVITAAFLWMNNQKKAKNTVTPAKSSQVESIQPKAQPTVGTEIVNDKKTSITLETIVAPGSSDRTNDTTATSPPAVPSPSETTEKFIKIE